MVASQFDGTLMLGCTSTAPRTLTQNATLACRSTLLYVVLTGHGCCTAAAACAGSTSNNERSNRIVTWWGGLTW